MECALAEYKKLLAHAETHRRRLERGRRESKLYYRKNATRVLASRVLESAARGAVPLMSTVKKHGIDRVDLAKAWARYADAVTEMPDHARKFHREITGEEWRPSA